MIFYIFICSWLLFLFCHNIFWKLDSFISQNRNAIPRTVTCFSGVTYSWISVPYQHLCLSHLNIKSMKEICRWLTQIELRTFVSSSSVYWTAKCFLQIPDFPSTNEGDYRTEEGFTCFLCQHRDTFTYFMDEKVQTKTPPAYGCLSLGFHFSVAMAVPGGGFLLPPV